MFKSSIAAVLSCLLLAVGSVQAAPVSGNFNSKGYDVFTIQVAADARVTFSATGGYNDPTISLFSASGQHLISNDDSNGSLLFRLTQDLAAGQYSVLISYCCNVIEPGALPGTSYVNTDGFNTGSYWVGGSGTLTTARSYLEQVQPWEGVPGAAYALDMRNADIAAIPEPATLALAGLGLMGVAVARRRQK